MTDTWLGAPTLEYGTVVLRPLALGDAEELGGLVGDPEVFRWSPGVPANVDEARTFVETALRAREAGQRTAFAVIDNGRLVGSTSYYAINPADLGVAIGHTFYTESAQGTRVNPTSKFLLLRHAFEDCGAVRVEWHTNEHNARSRAAIAKLGAQFEGLMRKHKRFGDGWRTTALYAMTDDDWPAAKAALLNRI
ncbi:GNAT family N-acetyltransferase [Gordonia sp. (in: high G+C Gram-positive bacteria)]|uniref:GNAT family N-acetyltransferase n=1 Tax=Gordonia sp. (in: high G+C Gram-positive bacteria) TaxID=84139 RepID=UPI0039E5B99B